MAYTKRGKYFVATIRDLDDEKLHCRAYGHRWEQGPVNRFSPVGREVWVIDLRCPCGKRRRDYVEPGTFDLDERWYNKPDGYGVIEPVDRKDFREEAIRRQRERQHNKDVPLLSLSQDEAWVK